ncbi:CHC2 zinc finger domain-containing protein [Paludibaculum fermentans]|uniref:Toprim domain-containing protein n=1 Tax=Paludibaculum fermentans TaxID=1473598 RepID=A0A7S7SL01_PALFE|nr:DNA primase [Paludibaculum fermentans]QOY87936.1 toprim domain-containing protein [Paludibaculum fermentans]
MARIPDSELERLKREIPIERLVTGFGVELQRHGAELIGTCPFHDDKTPSLVVSPKTNLWHCLGACNVGGSTLDWVMRTKGVSFRHAAELLRADHPSLAAGDGHVVRKGTAVKLEAPVALDADDRQTLRDVVSFYHKTLGESPEALRYLESRGLTHPEMMDRFQLGFANRTLGLTLPDRNRKAGADLRGRLQRLGILRESGHEHFMGSVVFPVIDLASNVTEIYGRKITAGLRAGTPLHTYLPGPHCGVWNEEALTASKEIILCESIIDALTFWCAGFRNVTASYGVNGFTDDHRTAFQKHGVQQVWIAYDRDEAGDVAAERLKEELLALGIGSHRVLFPKGLDANEYARTGESLAVLLNRATWWEGPKPAAQEKSAEPEVEATPAEAPPPVIPFAAEPEVLVNGDEVLIPRGDRRYRIRGLAKNLSPEVMKVNVLVSRQEDFHVDTLDLQTDRQRAAFIKRAAEELGLKEDILRKDVGQVFLALERLQSEQIRKALEPAKPEVELSEEERAEALTLLKDPRLLERIVEDFDRCGLVGEKSNKLIGYLAAVSRHLESPLAVLVQSSSAAGKSTLMDAVLAFVPAEECIRFSAMTEQSLYYMGSMDLRHKVLAIAEEEGASRAAYALKLLQSEGVLSIASTGKDPATGKLVTHQYRVEGPVMMFLTTTAIDIDEELLNRCLVLAVNEDREQTQAIHRLQREQQTLEGLVRRQQRATLIKMHQNAQRLLKPLFVVNPFVDELTFPDALTRMRRDHMKYLTLIRAIALLHQHQRPVRTSQGLSFIEVTRADIAKAQELMDELMRRSLDELPAQTRRLLGLVEEMVSGECGRLRVDRRDFRFSRRDVRAHTGWGHTQLKTHLHRLEELEYLIVHHGGRGQTFVYELNWSGLEEEKSGASRPQVGVLSGAGRATETRMNTGANGILARKPQNTTDTGLGVNGVVTLAIGAR